MSSPDARATPTKIIESLNKNMQQVKKSEYQKIKSILTKFLKNPITFTERRQTVNKSMEKINESYKKLQDQKDSNRNWDNGKYLLWFKIFSVKEKASLL